MWDGRFTEVDTETIDYAAVAGGSIVKAYPFGTPGTLREELKTALSWKGQWSSTSPQRKRKHVSLRMIQRLWPISGRARSRKAKVKAAGYEKGKYAMKEIIWKPELHRFRSCKEFVEEFRLGASDLILTNEYIYQPYFGAMNLECAVLYQEQYGMGEPTDVMAEAILRDAAATGCNRVVAIGGGTVIDIAKVLAVGGGESIDELYGMAPELPKRRELVLIPTTCGTGSEVTNISPLNRTRLGTKMGLVGRPCMRTRRCSSRSSWRGCPSGVFATSSIDALVHAVESSLSPKATPYTKLFGYKAIEMLIRGYQTIAREGREARLPLLEDFLIASNYAGFAFGTAGCAAVHAMSYPRGGKYHVPHGESNYAMFTGVLKNYMEIKQDGELAVMNRYLAELLGCGVPEVYDRLEDLLNQILPKKPLHAYRGDGGGSGGVHQERDGDPGPADGQQLRPSGCGAGAENLY